LDLEAVDDDAWEGDDGDKCEEQTDEDEYFNNSFIDDGESQGRRESTSSLASVDNQTMYLQSVCSPMQMGASDGSRRLPSHSGFANHPLHRTHNRLKEVTSRLEQQLALEAPREDEVFVEESEDEEDEVSMLWGSGGQERLVREIQDIQEAKREKRKQFTLAAVRAHAEKWKGSGPVGYDSDISTPLSESNAKPQEDHVIRPCARQPQQQANQNQSGNAPGKSTPAPCWSMVFETTEAEEADMMAIMDALEQKH
jgi:hypothetical protein